jgi:hypothetical protein
MIAGLTLYLLSSVACTLAPSLPWLVAARFRAGHRLLYRGSRGSRGDPRCLYSGRWRQDAGQSQFITFVGSHLRSHIGRISASGIWLARRVRRASRGRSGCMDRSSFPNARVECPNQSPVIASGQLGSWLPGSCAEPGFLGLRPAGNTVLRIDLRLHLGHALRPDPRTRNSDRALWLLFRLRRAGLPRWHAAVPAHDWSHRPATLT